MSNNSFHSYVKGISSPRCHPSSAVSLLSIPVEYMFSEHRLGQTDRPVESGGERNALTDSQRPSPKGLNHFPKGPLFSRSEVSCLLRVTFLASELDVLISIAFTAIERSSQCEAFCELIEAASKHESSSVVRGVSPLRTLLPLLEIHGQSQQFIALNHVTSEGLGIVRILNELNSCANELKAFAEQNWNMADQFDWALIPGQSNAFSKERRAVAEVEEAIVERIHNLREMSNSSQLYSDISCRNKQTCNETSSIKDCLQNINEFDAFEKANDTESGSLCSMDAFCEDIFMALLPAMPQISNKLKTSRCQLPGRSEAMEVDGVATSQVSISVQNAAKTLHVMGLNS